MKQYDMAVGWRLSLLVVSLCTAAEVWLNPGGLTRSMLQVAGLPGALIVTLFCVSWVMATLDFLVNDVLPQSVSFHFAKEHRYAWMFSLCVAHCWAGVAISVEGAVLVPTLYIVHGLLFLLWVFAYMSNNHAKACAEK